MKLVAHQKFYAGHGMHLRVGEEFEATDNQARQLIARGLAGPKIIRSWPEPPKYEVAAFQPSHQEPMVEAAPDRPFVTCLCLTWNRPQWLRKAIECYRSQTYHPRELLIVADGEDVAGIVPPDDDIRYVWMAGKSKIGPKRNTGCREARGEIICHWDDDDWSGPDRIEDQVRWMQQTGKAVTGYQSMYFTDGSAWWLYNHKAPTYCLGTSLCYRRDWWQEHPFRQTDHVAEDKSFIGPAFSANEFAVKPAGLLMYATVHPGNSSPRDLKRNNNFVRLVRSPFEAAA